MVPHPACNADLDHNLHIPRPERVLLWTVRTWVIGRIQGFALDAAIEGAFARIGAHEAAVLQLGLMEALEHGAVRPLLVECVCCRCVNADERRILDVVAMFQHERDFEATLLLRSIVTHPAAFAARASANRLAIALQEHDLLMASPPKWTDRRIAALSYEVADGMPVGRLH